jgi:hypothetical protein
VRGGAPDFVVLLGGALLVGLVVVALLRFLKTPVPAAIVAALLVGVLGVLFATPFAGGPQLEASAPAAEEAPATDAALPPQPEAPPAAQPPAVPAPPAEGKPAPQAQRESAAVEEARKAVAAREEAARAAADQAGASRAEVDRGSSRINEERARAEAAIKARSAAERPAEIGPKIALGAPPPPPPPPSPPPSPADDEASAAPPVIVGVANPRSGSSGTGAGAGGAALGASPEPEAAPPPPQKVGSFSVNKPAQMSVLKSVQIEVQVGVEGEPAPTELGSGGPVTTREIEVSRKMDVELVSNDFDVAADGKNGALLVLPGKPARWAWQVKPRSSGPGKVIKVNVYSVLGDDRALVKTHQETIEVTVTPVEQATLVARWSKDNWEPLASLAGGIAAAFGFVSGLLGLRKKKPPTA